MGPTDQPTTTPTAATPERDPEFESAMGDLNSRIAETDLALVATLAAVDSLGYETTVELLETARDEYESYAAEAAKLRPTGALADAVFEYIATIRESSEQIGAVIRGFEDLSQEEIQRAVDAFGEAAADRRYWSGVIENSLNG